MMPSFPGQQNYGMPFHPRQPPTEPYQMRSDTVPRFFATPEEKMQYQSNQPQNMNFQTTYPDSFISIIIDGNRFQFLDSLVAIDEAGGKQAAMMLTHAVGDMLRHMGYEVTRLIIRVFGNPEWLCDAYLAANVIPHRANFGWFLQGFDSVESLVEFVAVDDGPCTLVYRMRSATDLLKVNLLDPHCLLILYGGLLDEKAIQILTSNPATTTNNRLLLLETTHSTPNPLPTLPRISFPHLFLPTPHLPPIHPPRPTIHRNILGQRIDPPLSVKETVITWLRAQKFCNNHFLLGHCPDSRCKARHDGRLTAEQLDGLRYLGRGLPCRHSNACKDAECYAGHMCPFEPCGNRKCKFYAEMHVTDRRIVGEDEVMVGRLNGDQD